MFFDLTDPVPARWADRSPVPDSHPSAPHL